MKIEDLLEMAPIYNPKEMPSIVKGIDYEFYSNDTLQSDFEPIKEYEKDKLWVFMKKDRSLAILGRVAVRPSDKKVGVSILISMDMKDEINITHDRAIFYDKSKVVQVDGVEAVNENIKRKGYGFLLYLALIQYGYVVISDNYQYIGGKEIWKKDN